MRDIDDVVSNERLGAFILGSQPWNEEIEQMATELLALRKELERAEPVGDVVDKNGNLPCPFCGGRCDPNGWMGSYDDGVPVCGPECEGCGATANSIEDWNRRSTALAGKAVVPDCLQRLLKHAEGLTFGSDWNNGTAAKYHRDALIQAVKDCRAAMLNQK